MKLGSEGVFVGSGIFRSADPAKRARAIVMATTYYNDPKVVAEVSEDLGEAMPGIEIATIPKRKPSPKRLVKMEKVGVLALQGSFAEHLAILRRIPGIEPLEVKTIAQLEAVDRLIIPGGESTAIGKLLRKTGMLTLLQSA